jgi:hypothetical protein
MRRDTIFYQLFRHSPNLLFDLISQPPEDADGYSHTIVGDIKVLLTLDRNRNPTFFKKSGFLHLNSLCRNLVFDV